MAKSLVLGSTSTSGATFVNANYLFAQKFAASQDAILNEIQVYGIGTGNVKTAVARYTGGLADPPDDEVLNVVNNNGTGIVASQWNPITIPSMTIINGAYYWIIVLTSANCIRRNSNGSGTTYYYGRTYSSGIPDPLPSGFSTYTTDDQCTNGWGVDIIGVPGIFSGGF